MITRVNTSSRPVELLGFALPRTSGGQGEAFAERDQVGTVGLQDRAVARMSSSSTTKSLSLLLDRAAVGEEAAPDPVRDVAQVQVDARRLDARRRNLELARVDEPQVDRPAEGLAREHPLAVGGKAERLAPLHHLAQRQLPSRHDPAGPGHHTEPPRPTLRAGATPAKGWTT